MTINRVLTLAAILVMAIVAVYLWRAHRELRRPRVFVMKIPNKPEEEFAQVTKYLRETCPDIVLTKEEGRADYTIGASWYGPPQWNVFVSGKNNTIYWKGNRDAMEVFRQACAAIRDNAKELADFDAQTAPMPLGRYSLNGANGHILLLDTKTGAVWELKPGVLRDRQEFERISVEGLYYFSEPLPVGP
jgi:hypothetical protein